MSRKLLEGAEERRDVRVEKLDVKFSEDSRKDMKSMNDEASKGTEDGHTGTTSLKKQRLHSPEQLTGGDGSDDEERCGDGTDNDETDDGDKKVVALPRISDSVAKEAAGAEDPGTAIEKTSDEVDSQEMAAAKGALGNSTTNEGTSSFAYFTDNIAAACAAINKESGDSDPSSMRKPGKPRRLSRKQKREAEVATLIQNLQQENTALKEENSKLKQKVEQLMNLLENLVQQTGGIGTGSGTAASRASSSIFGPIALIRQQQQQQLQQTLLGLPPHLPTVSSPSPYLASLLNEQNLLAQQPGQMCDFSALESLLQASLGVSRPTAQRTMELLRHSIQAQRPASEPPAATGETTRNATGTEDMAPSPFRPDLHHLLDQIERSRRRSPGDSEGGDVGRAGATLPAEEEARAQGDEGPESISRADDLATVLSLALLRQQGDRRSSSSAGKTRDEGTS